METQGLRLGESTGPFGMNLRVNQRRPDCYGTGGRDGVVSWTGILLAVGGG